MADPAPARGIRGDRSIKLTQSILSHPRSALGPSMIQSSPVSKEYWTTGLSGSPVGLPGLSGLAAIDSDAQTIWIANAHRDDGKRFVVRADEKLTAFLELEFCDLRGAESAVGISKFAPSVGVRGASAPLRPEMSRITRANLVRSSIKTCQTLTHCRANFHPLRPRAGILEHS